MAKKKPQPNQPSLDSLLEKAAGDWTPESAKKSKKTTVKSGVSKLAERAAAVSTAGSDATVAWVEDPFKIPTLDVSRAQSVSDELDLPENEDGELGDDEAMDLIENEALDAAEAKLEETLQEAAEQAESLARVARAVAEETEKHQAELEAIVESSETEAAERLAAEIREDEALAAAEAEEDDADELDPELARALPQVDSNGDLDLIELESCIETLLFMADRPMSVDKLRELLGPDAPLSRFQEAVTSLRDRYGKAHHGFELAEIAGGLQFRTKPGRAALAKKLAKVQSQRLSSGAMETLAIVAYRQPVMKEDIDKVRGVDSSHFIRGLLDKNLIEISGRSELPGRPMLYGTGKRFLEVFGLKNLHAMPPLKEVEAMVPQSQSQNPGDEDPRVKEMRRLVGEMKADNTRLAYDPGEDEKILDDIRDRVGGISTSTPFIDEQKAIEKAIKEGRPIPGSPEALALEAAEAEAKAAAKEAKAQARAAALEAAAAEMVGASTEGGSPDEALTGPDAPAGATSALEVEPTSPGEVDTSDVGNESPQMAETTGVTVDLASTDSSVELPSGTS